MRFLCLQLLVGGVLISHLHAADDVQSKIDFTDKIKEVRNLANNACKQLQSSLKNRVPNIWQKLVEVAPELDSLIWLNQAAQNYQNLLDNFFRQTKKLSEIKDDIVKHQTLVNQFCDRINVELVKAKRANEQDAKGFLANADRFVKDKEYSENKLILLSKEVSQQQEKLQQAEKSAQQSLDKLKNALLYERSVALMDPYRVAFVVAIDGLLPLLSASRYPKSLVNQTLRVDHVATLAVARELFCKGELLNNFLKDFDQDLKVLESALLSKTSCDSSCSLEEFEEQIKLLHELIRHSCISYAQLVDQCFDECNQSFEEVKNKYNYLQNCMFKNYESKRKKWFIGSMCVLAAVVAGVVVYKRFY